MSLHPVSDAPRTHWIDRVALLGLIGEVVEPGVEQLVVGLGPVVEERGSEPIDGRATDQEVGVAPLALVPRIALPLVGDPDAAGEGRGLVDDHDLAVRAVVDLRGPHRCGLAEPPDPDAGVLHHVDESVLDRVRPPAIQQQADAHPVPRAVRQRLGEPLAHLAAPVDEREEVHRVARALDRLEHRGEDRVAVAQDLDAVPLGEGDADDAFERATCFVGSEPVGQRGGHGTLTVSVRSAGVQVDGSAGASRVGPGTPARTASACAESAAPNSRPSATA